MQRSPNNIYITFMHLAEACIQSDISSKLYTVLVHEYPGIQTHDLAVVSIMLLFVIMVS